MARSVNAGRWWPALALASMLGLLATAPRAAADAPTPFLEIHNAAGEVSEARGWVVATDAEGHYGVIVASDTGEHVWIAATAAAGVVADADRGVPVIVRARVVTARDPARGREARLEIVGVRRDLLLSEAEAIEVARAAAVAEGVDLTPYPKTAAHYSGAYGVWRVVFRGDGPGAHRMVEVDDVTREATLGRPGR